MKIVGVAIKRSDGRVESLREPNRHNDIFALYPNPFGEQGFITDMDEFVSREDALLIARKAKQVIREVGDDNRLFSEMVW